MKPTFVYISEKHHTLATLQNRAPRQRWLLKISIPAMFPE